MGERVTVGVADDLGGIGVAGKVTLASGIAPGAFGIPVPSLHKEFGILAVRDLSPSRGEDLLDGFRLEEGIGGVAGNAVNGRTERVKRAKRICDMAGSGVDADGLRGELWRGKKDRKQKQRNDE